MLAILKLEASARGSFEIWTVAVNVVVNLFVSVPSTFWVIDAAAISFDCRFRVFLSCEVCSSGSSGMGAGGLWKGRYFLTRSSRLSVLCASPELDGDWESTLS